MGLREYLVSEIKKEQEALKERLAFNPVEDFLTSKETVGEIRGLQRVVRLIEDLPDE